MTLEHLEILPRAFVKDDAILIENLQVTSPEAVRTAHAFEERTHQVDVGDHVAMLIDIGGKAVAIGSSTVDVDEIKRSLDLFTSNVAASAKTSVADLRLAVDKATDSDTGTIARSVSQSLQALTRDIDHIVEGEESPIRVAIGQTVKNVTDKVLGEVQRSLSAHQAEVHRVLSTDSPDSPFNTLKLDLLRGERETREDIKANLNEIKTLVQVAKEHRATMAKTAIKGLDYEDAVVASLIDLGHGAGDSVEATGSSVGSMPRCKKGDAVITLAQTNTRGHTIKVAVEAKDTALSCEQWRTELEAARRNREATAAIGVARLPEQVPGHQHVFILDPLHIVVAFDPTEDDEAVLYAVYHLVRAQATALVLDGAEQEFDVTALQQNLSKATDLLDDFEKVDRAVIGARRQLDDIEKAGKKLHANLATTLAEATRILETNLDR